MSAVCSALAWAGSATHAQNNPAWDAPANYYAAATDTGPTVRTQLRTIISAGFVSRSYDSARQYMSLLDRDPSNSSRILLIYNRTSVSGTWDSGVTWNREHIWPESLLSGSQNQDAFNLRPANPVINSERGNDPFGTVNTNSQPTTFGPVNSNNGSGSYWFPGNADKGDVARTIFYMATRYSNLNVANGQAGNLRMGDLQSLLRYHYQDAPDDFERRRNHYIYSQSLNPTYYQGNRNPYIDRPEFVWAAFGSGANDSQITVNSAGVPASGATAITVDLGRAIVGSSLGSRVATINKTGNAPTTYNATVTGPISSTVIGTGRTFDFSSQSISTTLAYTGPTNVAALINASLTLDNTDLTTSATGRGSQDGNDTITVTGAFLNPSNASFASNQSTKSASLDLGIWAKDTPVTSTSFSVFNVGNSLTAGLDLDSFSFTGPSDVFTTNASASSLLPGSGANFAISLVSATTTGLFNSTLNILNSDENIPGAQSRQSLSLSISARVALGGDANLDGRVDFADLVELARSFNQSGRTWNQGDFNRDGQANFEDLVMLARNFNQSAGVGGGSFESEWARAQALAIPEPATLAMFAMLGSLLIARRRKLTP
jgi:endonuclease I